MCGTGAYRHGPCIAGGTFRRWIYPGLGTGLPGECAQSMSHRLATGGQSVPPPGLFGGQILPDGSVQPAD